VPPVYAQLYVHDPGAADDTLELRLSRMSLPKTSSRPERARAEQLLVELNDILRSVNPYVRDFVTAAEMMENDVVPTRSLYIAPDAAPANASTRVYNAFDALHEVSVLMPNIPGLSEAPKCELFCIDVIYRELTQHATARLSMVSSLLNYALLDIGEV